MRRAWACYSCGRTWDRFDPWNAEVWIYQAPPMCGRCGDTYTLVEWSHFRVRWYLRWRALRACYVDGMARQRGRTR